ncbi:BT4734/BF3469 family protein [Pontibacter sp. HSC-36F09]|uniref:BT4734/BF3469 family protein n=1 Tax=Pontibacter sp. HSC-36F09 TaxID=2910966 RepID=UPI0020A0C62F|nr:BT4734/BF3469 family protein [Pontibacter sp. HSC-36F09]MCP2043489.1 hypothetical protein [Pontibacter sp. HSC-36F09]
MESVLNVQVSCFERCFIPNEPKAINLLTWLTSDKYKEQVAAIRREPCNEARKKLKRILLPVVAASGQFTYRDEKYLTQHSGLLQFDIDQKENLHLTNLAEARQLLSKLPYVAYCGISVSGQGIWGLVRISDTSLHSEHFEYLFKVLSEMGLKLDRGPQNVASARYYSYDPDAYFNHQAEPMQGFIQAPKEEYYATRTASPTDDQAKVEACINEIIRQRIDITSSYHKDWLPIGCNFASTFGKSGRIYFHRVSQFHTGYSKRETNKQYDRCLKISKGAATLGTFMKRCAENGINYTDLLTGTQQDKV